MQDIVTEDSESSSEFEEGTSGEDDSESGSQAGGPRHKVDIDIGNALKKVLELDYDLINNKNKVQLHIFKIEDLVFLPIIHKFLFCSLLCYRLNQQS